MKFSTIFSLFLTTLSVGVGASPIPNGVVTQAPVNITSVPAEFNQNLIAQDDESSTKFSQLVQRNPTYEDSAEYKQFAAIHSGLEKDKWYAFTVKYIYGASPGDSAETEDVKNVQKAYGFDHIEIIIGQVKETALKKKTKRDFVAHFHHLVMDNEKSRKTEYKSPKWEARKQKDGKAEPKIEFDKAIASANKANDVSKKGE